MQENEDEHCPSQVTNIRTVNLICKMLKCDNKQGQSYSRPKRDISNQSNWICDESCDYLEKKWILSDLTRLHISGHPI